MRTRGSRKTPRNESFSRERHVSLTKEEKVRLQICVLESSQIPHNSSNRAVKDLQPSILFAWGIDTLWLWVTVWSNGDKFVTVSTLLADLNDRTCNSIRRLPRMRPIRLFFPRGGVGKNEIGDGTFRVCSSIL